MPNAASLKRKLFAAAKKRDANAVRESLALGVDVAGRDGNGWTALHEACRYGCLDACAALLEAGADPNADHREFHFRPLFVATFNAGNVAIVHLLLAAGGDPSFATPHGWTALHNAAEQGDLEALEALLAAGGDPTILGGPERAIDVVARAKPDWAAAVAELVARYASK